MSGTNTAGDPHRNREDGEIFPEEEHAGGSKGSHSHKKKKKRGHRDDRSPGKPSSHRHRHRSPSHSFTPTEAYGSSRSPRRGRSRSPLVHVRRSKSPHGRSKSPRRHSKSSERRSRSPVRRTRSPPRSPGRGSSRVITVHNSPRKEVPSWHRRSFSPDSRSSWQTSWGLTEGAFGRDPSPVSDEEDLNRAEQMLQELHGDFQGSDHSDREEEPDKPSPDFAQAMKLVKHYAQDSLGKAGGAINEAAPEGFTMHSSKPSNTRIRFPMVPQINKGYNHFFNKVQGKESKKPFKPSAFPRLLKKKSFDKYKMVGAAWGDGPKELNPSFASIAFKKEATPTALVPAKVLMDVEETQGNMLHGLAFGDWSHAATGNILNKLQGSTGKLNEHIDQLLKPTSTEQVQTALTEVKKITEGQKTYLQYLQDIRKAQTELQEVTVGSALQTLGVTQQLRKEAILRLVSKSVPAYETQQLRIMQGTEHLFSEEAIKVANSEKKVNDDSRRRDDIAAKLASHLEKTAKGSQSFQRGNGRGRGLQRGSGRPQGQRPQQQQQQNQSQSENQFSPGNRNQSRGRGRGKTPFRGRGGRQ